MESLSEKSMIFIGSVLERGLTENRFSVFHFIKNQNCPLIAQLKITPPKCKMRYFVETDCWAHRKEVAGDFFSSESKIKNVEFGFVEGISF